MLELHLHTLLPYWCSIKIECDFVNVMRRCSDIAEIQCVIIVMYWIALVFNGIRLFCLLTNLTD